MKTGMVLWIDSNNLHHHQVKYKKAYNYAKLMEKGVDFPPVKVYVDKNGKLLVSDGAHRSAAAKMLQEKVLVEIIGMASDDEDYSKYFKYKPRSRDFWYKGAK